MKYKCELCNKELNEKDLGKKVRGYYWCPKCIKFKNNLPFPIEGKMIPNTIMRENKKYYQ